MSRLNELSAVAAAADIAAGRITSEQLTRACLERIAEREKYVRAWAYLSPEQSIAEARARDRGPRWSLDGQRILVFGDGTYAVDASGNVYVGGTTSSTNLPVVNPYQGLNAGSVDGFVVKVNAAGSGLVYSTYLGGKSSEASNERGGLAIDPAGNVYLVGTTASTDFSSTPTGWCSMSGSLPPAASRRRKCDLPEPNDPAHQSLKVVRQTRILEIAPGYTLEEVAALTGTELLASPSLAEVAV